MQSRKIDLVRRSGEPRRKCVVGLGPTVASPDADRTTHVRIDNEELRTVDLGRPSRTGPEFRDRQRGHVHRRELDADAMHRRSELDEVDCASTGISVHPHGLAEPRHRTVGSEAKPCRGRLLPEVAHPSDRRGRILHMARHPWVRSAGRAATLIATHATTRIETLRITHVATTRALDEDAQLAQRGHLPHLSLAHRPLDPHDVYVASRLVRAEGNEELEQRAGLATLEPRKVHGESSDAAGIGEERHGAGALPTAVGGVQVPRDDRRELGWGAWLQAARRRARRSCRAVRPMH